MASAAKDKSERLAKKNENLEKLLATNPFIPRFDADDHVELRERTAIPMTPARSNMAETSITITARDGHEMHTRVFAIAGSAGQGAPVFVLYHFGGFVLADPDAMERECRDIVQGTGCIVIAPAYRRGPEYPFPKAPEDAWDALKWIAGHAAEVGGDLSKGFVAGGVSPGGNLAAVVALQARDEKLSPPLTGVHLCIPFLLSPEAVPEKYKHLYLSYEQNWDAPILDQKNMKWFMGHYKPDVKSWRFNPFNHPDGHAGLPPVYFQVCGRDPLRDEALIYEQVLREEYGVKTKLDMYAGLPHIFWNIWGELEESKQAKRDAVEGAAWLLQQHK